MQEIKESSLQYEGLKHYFLITFTQRPGALREFLNHVLGPNDDITRFEYMQKHNKETGPALVGSIEDFRPRRLSKTDGKRWPFHITLPIPN
jgi:hypothetical protein